jgi:hypothetical protein
LDGLWCPIGAQTLPIDLIFEDKKLPHEVFLATAEGFLGDGHFDPAVVSSQTACELATELALWYWFGRKGKGAQVAEPVMDLFQSFNLGNERLLRIYVALSGDTIQERPFWPRFKEHVRRRNEIVHRGYRSSEAEAQTSVEIAREFVTHIAGTLPRRVRVRD